MRSCYVLVVVIALWNTYGESRSARVESDRYRRGNIVRKQHVPGLDPSNIRKQNIGDYGGGSLGNLLGYEGQEVEPNYFDAGGNSMSSPANIPNALQGAGFSLDGGLSQDESNVMTSTLKDGNEMASMSNDLVEGNEGTEGREIGTGLNQGGVDTMLAGATNGVNGLSAGGGLGNGLFDSISQGLGAGGGLGGTEVGGGMVGGDLGGGSMSAGTIGDNFGALNDGIGTEIGGTGGNLGGASAGLGGGLTGGGSLGVTGSLGGIGDGLGGTGDGRVTGLGAALGSSQSDSLAGLGSNGGMDGGLGLDGMGSHLTAAGKQAGTEDFAGLGGSLGEGSHLDMTELGGGNMVGMGGSHQTSEDSQLSDAVDENPDIHPGLTSILPGKTVHAHVSDKPTGNRPAVTAPSVAAAMQVQMEAQKQHQERLKALKIKLKKLREKLEKLQSSASKQDIASTSEQQNNEELDTLNDLKKATQDAIKELHTDYPHARKHLPVARKHETLGTKLKTVDFTAKETGDTLEELLRLLDPELLDKKRAQVNGKKRKNTRLDVKAENKLASLTKKAEDEVDRLASQNPKQKSVIRGTVTDNKQFAKSANKTTFDWKGLEYRRDKLKSALLKLGETSSVQETENIRYASIGCWRDDPNRVVPSLENTSPLLESGYRVREDSIKKCAKVAKKQGFSGFAVENGGQCFGGRALLRRYTMYGRSKDCANDGRGGDYAMEVYKFLS